MKRFTFLILLLLMTAQIFSQTNQEMNSAPYSTEIIRYKVSTDQHEEFLKSYSEAVKFLQASKYCQGYEIIQGDEEPNNFMVIIYWTSKEEHLQTFRKSAEFGSFFNLIKQYYNNIEEMKHYVSKVEWKKN